MAVAVEFAYLMLDESLTSLLGFFDITAGDDNAIDPQSKYEELFGNAPSYHNYLAIFLDLTHHSLLIFFYSGIAFAMTDGAYHYFGKAILGDDADMENPFWDRIFSGI